MIRSIFRISTFFGRWFAELAQQPALMVTLIAGPFFILLMFGGGIRPTPPEPTVILAGERTWSEEEQLFEEIEQYFNVAAVIRDVEAANAMLHVGAAHAVLVLPTDPLGQFEQGQHAAIRVFIKQVDPAQEMFTNAYLRNQVHQLNQQTTRLMVTQAQDTTREMRGSIDEAVRYASLARNLPGNPGDQNIDGLHEQLEQTAEAIDGFNQTTPDLFASPFQLEIENLARLSPSHTAFYGPAVLVLLIQHLAVTLGALTMTRIRLLGIMDLLRVSPVRPFEMVIGNYLSYGVLCGIASAALTALLVFALDVPLFGSVSAFALAMVLLIVSSLGIGFVIAAVSSSEQQSAQAAMLVLLASIFFSALLFPLDQIAWPAQAIAYVLPATYGIRSVQELMLHGNPPAVMDLAVLGGAALALFSLATVLLRREWQPD